MPRVHIGKVAILIVCAAAHAGFSAETSTVVPSWASVHAFDNAWKVPLELSRPPLRSHRARLANVSIRAMVMNSSVQGTATIQGLGSMPVLVRAVGPTLAQYGVTNAARSVYVSVRKDGRTLAASNYVPLDAIPAARWLGAFPLVQASSSGENDAAVGGRPTAGTVQAEARLMASNPGVAMLEFYDASADPALSFARFSRLSAETAATPGDGVLVLGFVVAGEGEIRLLLRALGPRPVPSGPQLVQPSDPSGAGPLPPADPAIELYHGPTLIAENDSWRSDERSGAEIRDAAGTLGTPLGDDVNAGLVVTLRSGAYTLQVRDRTGGTGLVLAEICELPPVVSAVNTPGGGTGTAGTATRDFDPADAVNAVGLGIYRRLAAGSSAPNVAISPYSIQTALALAYTGAAGDTRREMAEALRFPDDNMILQAGFATVRDAMSAVVEESRKTAAARTAGGKPTRPIEWHAANRLYGQTGYGFRDSFLTFLRDGFGAPLVELDFRQQPEPARLAINAWVREETQQKIVDVIPGGGLGASTRLVLVNAIYLNAPWGTPFKRENTVPRPFNLTPDNRVDVPTMQETVEGCYSAEDGFAVAGVGYLGGGLRFLILLPNANESVETVAARLTPAHFARWSRLGSGEVILYLPKFKIAGSTVSLADTLRAMGIRTAFAAGANFDGMAPRTIEPLRIQDVFHQAFVALDEEGTEAAAATAVSGVAVSAPLLRVEMRVDRPFLFAIQDRATGTCLFLGRMTDPR